MEDQYGSDYIVISDEDGKEYELELLSTITWNDTEYMAVIPASGDGQEQDYGVSILRSSEVDGEPVLDIIEDEQELQTVYDLIMDQLYEDEDQEDD